MGETKLSAHVHITIDGTKTHKKVKKDSFTLGRHADCDVNVLHPQVSRQHLRVVIQDEKVLIEDVGSSNGTFLNSNRIPPKQIHEIGPDDILQFGEEGPVIQIELEERKTSTTLSKLSRIESFISPIINHIGGEKSAIDSKALPPKPETPGAVQKVVQVKSSELPEPPKRKGAMPSTLVSNPLSQPLSTQQSQAEQVIEANKQAALILQKAELEAEEKAQEAHKRAMEIEARAEEIYKERIKASTLDAEKLFEDAREEAKKFLQESRAQAQSIREKAEQDARELKRAAEEKISQLMKEAESDIKNLKRETEEKTSELLSEAESEAKNLRKEAEEKATSILKEAQKEGDAIKAKRLSEADQIIEKKGEELLKATHERIEKERSEALRNLDSLKAQSSRLRESNSKAETELKELEKKLAELRKQAQHDENEAEAKKSILDKYREEEKELSKKLEQIKKETHEKELTQQKLKTEYEKLNLSISSLKSEKEEKEKEINAQLQALKNKVEEEKVALAKAETERMNQLKLETAEALKKFEQELIDEITSRKTQLTKEVLLQIESKCPGVALTDEWKNNQNDLKKIIQDIIGNADHASAKKVIDSKGKKKFSIRTKEKAFSMAMGLCMGAFIVLGTLEIMKHMDGESPIERMVSGAMTSAKEELEKRKFNPPQVKEVKDSYVDAVIYTKDFSSTYVDPKYQEEWNKAATLYLLKTWRIDEDKATRALAASAALVKDLAERKEKIHPDFVKSGIQKMRDAEKETIARIKSELGGQVRFESFKKYEKRFFEKYDRAPASK